MKIFLFKIAVLLCVTPALGQIDFDQIIPPAGTRPMTFEDFLVQTAWNNYPERRVFEQKIAIGNLQVKQQKAAWLEPISANVGFNSLRDTISLLGTQYLAPGYNYGFSLSLGAIFTNRNKVKIAKEQVKIDEFNFQTFKLSFRNEVLKRYNDYQLALEILQTRQKAENDTKTNFTLISELFAKNKATFEEYNEASIAHHNALEKRVTAAAAVTEARLELEAILGVEWRIVERSKARFSKRKN